MAIDKIINVTESNVYTEEIRQPDYADQDMMLIDELDKLPEIISAKIRANVFCVCGKGTMEVNVNGNHYTLEVGDVFVCPSGVVVERVMVSMDFKFSALVLSDRLVQELLSQNIDLWNRYMYLNHEHIVKANREEDCNEHEVFGQHVMELLRYLLRYPDMPLRKEMIHSMLQVVLLRYCAHLKEQDPEAQPATVPTQGHKLFYGFLKMLREEPHKHQPVTAYASRLCITPKYLSYVCKQVSGKPATEHIEDAVMEEIVRHLRNPLMTVKEIATQLGFDNLSFFGKYVKAHLGVSPNDYRKQLTI